MKQVTYQATISIFVKTEMEDDEELNTKEEIDKDIKKALQKCIGYDHDKYDIQIESNLEIK